MSDERHYYRLGLFVIFGVVLTVATLLVFGSDVLFGNSGPMLETYIDESVQGLDVGAPLKYRGVRIGRVEQIGFAEGLYTMRGDSEEVRRLGRLVVLRMRVDRAWAERNGSADYEKEIMRLVDQGLRIRVAIQGLTGTSYLEADYLDPQRNPPMKIAWKPAYIYVPSAQSAISRLGRSAEVVFDRLSALDIESVVLHLDGALVSITKAVEDAKLGAVSDETVGFLKEARETNRDLGKLVRSVDLVPTQKKLETLLDQANSTLRRVDFVVASGQGDLGEILDNLRVSSENLREVTNSARAYPSLVLFGDAPPQRIPERR
jgi:phospholipid/cholesterol/gamma-HCH transport system substrate-binding protein/paraquat-inducible protein B